MIEHICVEFNADKAPSRREIVEGRDLHIVAALHLARSIRRLASLDVPLFLHIDAVVDRILGMVVVAMGCDLTIFATPKGCICQVTPISVWVGAGR